MAPNEKDITEQLATIHSDVSALADTVSRLIAETQGIQKSLSRRLGEAGKTAADAAEWIFEETERLGGAAVNAAERGAAAVVAELERQIKRNPFSALVIAVGLVLAVGVIGRRPAPVSRTSPRKVRRAV
jgi:hypothetical protein